VSIVDLLAILANFATASGIAVASWQIWLSVKQARTSFEDGLTREFRDTIKGLPVDILLGREVSDETVKSNLGIFYQYFDLTNEQIFLRASRRVGEDTWKNWFIGIHAMMKLPAFRTAWTMMEDDTSSRQRFSELRYLLSDQSEADPVAWPQPLPPQPPALRPGSMS
jgi:hypothetical protein